ncbi:unnamed protein product [Cladocopium goreaui]|uniref:Uncharacterized protein n=1 Tax=Cladocopium goreaui TaxID=2562237 RepID=A0A9P1CW45_9DINO|nr:unnamed protein product [Cladocopium goreaui]
MHLLLRCQMSSRHPWTLSSVGIWNVQDRRVSFYIRMSTLQAIVLNVCARAQLSDDFDLSSVAPAHQEDSVQSGSLPCAKKCSSVLLHAHCAGRVAAASHALSKDQAQA